MTKIMKTAKVHRTYGTISHMMGKWILEDIEPHVSIRLKKIFPKIPAYAIAPFDFISNPEICMELEWFIQRYPLFISDKDKSLLHKGSKTFTKNLEDLDAILLPKFNGAISEEIFKKGKAVRHYQIQIAYIAIKKGHTLCGDTMGLGKTITGIATISLNKSGHSAVVVPAHLDKQWKEKIEEFTNLKVHIIKKGTAYNLPEADVYIFRYGMLRGWTEIFATRFFTTVVFDEIQDLRTGVVSQKGSAAKILCAHAKVKLGLSGTPIYNYGGEIWNIFNILHEGSLGTHEEFHREWCTSIGDNKYKVNNPEALGRYLREQHLLIRRTKTDVGQEVGEVTRIVEHVEYDSKSVKSFEEIAKQLAVTASTGSFVERGQASRELDMMARQITGIAKAESVARIAATILETGEPLILTGWHREVYNIWLRVLSKYNPVMHTGSESPKQKDDAKKAFINGKTNLLILSNRSGAGLDGLQHRCSTVINGELDWSPKVHEQIEKRVDREGQTEPVMIIFPVTDGGSDPVLMDLNGLKNSQANGIMDPDGGDITFGSDESRIKKLVKYYLEK